MTVRELRNRAIAALEPSVGAGEAAALVRIIFESVVNLDPVQTVLRGDSELPDFIPPKVDGIVSRIKAGEPVQYILSRARFCGMELKVTPAVLIPRPETEQLVDTVCDLAGSRPDLKILDCGTGSGCIAIALARALRFPRVTAIDFSEAALAVAADNVRALAPAVELLRADMLRPETMPEGEWDFIVSNPPYVLDSERAEMLPNVLDHEPHSALFVPDSDPMRFYDALLSYANDGHLTPGGRVCFEINPLEADRFAPLASSLGFGSTEIITDIHGRKRFAIISRQ